MPAVQILPSSDEIFMARVHEFLRSTDLLRCGSSDMAERLSVSYSTLQRRMKAAGTSWEQEKRREKLNRLGECLVTPGAAPEDMATHCGFWGMDSFYRFFRESTGVNFATYKASK